MEKSIQQKQKAGIVTSLNDTTLTTVPYEVAYGIYECFSSHPGVPSKTLSSI